MPRALSTPEIFKAACRSDFYGVKYPITVRKCLHFPVESVNVPVGASGILLRAGGHGGPYRSQGWVVPLPKRSVIHGCGWTRRTTGRRPLRRPDSSHAPSPRCAGKGMHLGILSGHPSEQREWSSAPCRSLGPSCAKSPPSSAGNTERLADGAVCLRAPQL